VCLRLCLCMHECLCERVGQYDVWEVVCRMWGCHVGLGHVGHALLGGACNVCAHVGNSCVGRVPGSCWVSVGHMGGSGLWVSVSHMGGSGLWVSVGHMGGSGLWVSVSPRQLGVFMHVGLCGSCLWFIDVGHACGSWTWVCVVHACGSWVWV
jgi:hypothetical protein